MEKLIVVPIDGSENALKSLNYLNTLFGSKHHLKLTLLHVLPGLPPILVEESRKSSSTARQLKEMEKKNISMAERVLTQAKKRLLGLGFDDKAVETVYRKREIGIARDICRWSEDKQADALVVSSQGRSRLEAFFTGEVANKLLEYVKICPVWLVKGTVKNKGILLAVDHSENAMRAVDHAGFILAGADAGVTIFHSRRDLRQFVPKEVLEEFPEVQKFWQHKAGEVVAPYLTKAREMLVQAGLAENQISVKVVDGSRNAAKDILKEAQENAVGTIILGRKGYSNVKDYAMGSVPKKVLERAADMAVCIVP
jgi:nucleotide-binding universal stress UspA family protein